MASGDTNSEEEAELQEAIHRSLADGETTPTPSAPPPSDIHDSVRAAEDAQLREAMQRSVAGDEATPTPSSHPPPSNVQDSIRAARLRRFGSTT